MAAATVNYLKIEWAVDHQINEVELSSLTSDQTEDIAHGGPTGYKADRMDVEWVTPPTALCAATVYRVLASDNTTNDTAAVKFVAENGGDLAGAVVRLRFHFLTVKGGGI